MRSIASFLAKLESNGLTPAQSADGRTLLRRLYFDLIGLRQRDLLGFTIVMITTEFGRTPYAQAAKGKLSKGRDHHPEGFTNVLAGGGFKPGFAYGATDEIGYSAVDNVVTTYDMRATLLHLLDINHTSADSGTIWRAHLSPDKAGVWTYEVSFVTGKEEAIVSIRQRTFSRKHQQTTRWKTELRVAQVSFCQGRDERNGLATVRFLRRCSRP